MPASSSIPEEIRVIDSHTEGEPTRVVVSGWPIPPGATMRERLDYMRAEQDHLRRAVVCEPRGHSAVVGALLTPPVSDGATSGIVFFNNGTYLGMCGHGLIGVVRTLQYMGRIRPGHARFDTPVGSVSAELHADGAVTIRNVASRCVARNVGVDVPGLGRVVGDIAYGGNWFFLVHDRDDALHLEDAVELTRRTQAISDALRDNGVRGDDGGVIDHIELQSAPHRPDANARNFVLCSGGDYDRSPCGTGTSAQMAALHARGELAPGQYWRQESITGSVFTGWLEERDDGTLVPFIMGTAFVTGEATLRFDPQDPFRGGL